MSADFPVVFYRGVALSLPDAVMQTRTSPSSKQTYGPPRSAGERLLAFFVGHTPRDEREFKHAVLGEVQHYLTGDYSWTKHMEMRKFVRHFVDGISVTVTDEGRGKKTLALKEDDVAEQLLLLRESVRNGHLSALLV